MNIAKVMNRDVRTCSATDTLNRAAQIMWEGDCGLLPVIDERGRAVAVVTDRDICMGAYMQGVPLWGAPVSSVMSKTIHTCRPTDDLATVEQLMQERRIRRIPVVDSEGILLGIVTLGDLARSSQSSTLHKAMEGLGIAKTLASICEPRPPEAAVAAE